MARVTIEDCVAHIPNRYLLVQTAVRRTRQMMEGSRFMVPAKNREPVIALREIAARKVRPILDPSGPAVSEPETAETEADEAILHTPIEEVTADQMDPKGSLEELRALESIPDDGFHEILEDEGEADEEDEDE